jgi:hypothetical protein
MWKRGARPNVLNRVKDEMSTIWPITFKNEFKDREVTELFKIRYLPLNPSRGVDEAQYHASQMTTKPGEEEGTTIKDGAFGTSLPNMDGSTVRSEVP